MLSEQQDEGVSVTVDHQGELGKLRASYVVGCDGAHSQVRGASNLALEGGEYDASFMLADIETTGTRLRENELATLLKGS